MDSQPSVGSSASGATDFRFLVATKVASSGVTRSVLNDDASSLYFLDFEKTRFVHVDFETETETVLCCDGFRQIKGGADWSNFVTVPSAAGETRFLAPIREKNSGKWFIVLFRANYSQRKVEVNSDYDISEQQLGKGGFGTVMKGYIHGQGEVAIKIMKCDTLLNLRKLLLSAITEAKKLKTINHKNIVKAFGYRIEEQQFLLFMELMKECVLDKILRSDGKRLGEYEALVILDQALEGLVHLHTLKPNPIVHRDIKCANMLLTNSGCVKLGDFGLVQTVSLTSSGATNPVYAAEGRAGTVFWQAPEVLKTAHSYGRKADVWSIGCSLVEMLTGYPPYFGMKLTEWVIKANDGTLSYNPIELVPETATNAIYILQKTFRRATKINIVEIERNHKNIRPHSWNVLAALRKVSMGKSETTTMFQHL